MIQLGYYPPQPSQDESLDFDPNYDPSDFLMKKDSSSQEQMPPAPQQQLQQQYQENYDYAAAGIQIEEGTSGADEIQPNFYGGFASTPAFNVGDFPSYQQSSQEDFMQQPTQQLMPAEGSVLADLEISDSDDEDQNEPNENPADTSKDEDGLWF